MRPTRNQIAGYIVVHDGVALHLAVGGDRPTSGVLTKGDYSTLFATWQRARRAVKRTITYAQKYELPWGLEMYAYKVSPVCKPEVLHG